jgi:L,D-peptidoglycan transpeptidase YkuD (ErfK/YbiS/YcfS/YnhG family)
MNENDGWCDDVNNKYYNQHVKLPFSGNYENLWRNDDIYDIIIPIGYNDKNIVAGKGSAIFFHIAKSDYSGTLGCVAVAINDMLEILRNLDKNSIITIINKD